MKTTRHRKMPKPYAMLGAGPLVSAVWKDGHPRSGWSYRFNIYRLGPHNGHVSQLLQPADLPDLVKLCQVLAATLADDGCIPPEQRDTLIELAAKLDKITHARN